MRIARMAMEADPPLYDQCVYHAQQVAEKAMKGFLTYHDIAFRKTHNLVEIGESCSRIDAALDVLLAEAAELTVYAWQFRYPGDTEDPTNDESRQAVDAAASLLMALLSRLPLETHP